MSIILVADGRWTHLPNAVEYWFLGGPEADSFMTRFYQTGWNTYDAQIYANAARWYFHSATAGTFVDQVAVGKADVPLRTGSILGANGACDIEIFVFTEDRDAKALLADFQRNGMAKDQMSWDDVIDSPLDKARG